MKKGVFQIDPMTQFWIGLAVAVMTLFANGVKMPVGVPDWVGPGLQSWNVFVLQIYSVVAPVLLLGSSSKPGPLAPPDSPAVMAAMAKEAGK